MQSPPKLSRMAVKLLLVLAVITPTVRSSSFAADPTLVLTSRWVISGEATLAYFSDRLNERGIQAWNISGRFGLLPFGIIHSHFLRGYLDGVLEIGFEPTFERFSVVHQPDDPTPSAHYHAQYQPGPPSHDSPSSSPTAGFANFGGLGLVLRYYLLHFKYGPTAPYIEAGIAPGGTDLKIGRVSNETRLTGDFMNRIKGGVGVSYFLSENAAAYVGLQAQHLSNAGLNGPNRNYALNTTTSFAIGASWFFH
jgi:Lipid A 3-O-deacylase (PagL)